MTSACPTGGRGATHHLVFHAGKDDIQHLSEGGLGSSLIDEVFAGQVDIVTCPHCLQDGALMNFNVWGSHCSQKSLKQIRNCHLHEHLPSSWSSLAKLS